MKMYKDLTSILTDLGVSPGAQNLYTSCLESDPLSSREIMGITKQPRQSVMTNLRILVNLGLCETEPYDKKSFRYIFLPPSQLKVLIGKKTRELSDISTKIDMLDTHQSVLNTRSVVGQEKVQELLDLALYCKKRTWWIASPYENAVRFMPKSYQDYFKTTRNERQIKSMSLWNTHLAKHSLHLRDQLMRKPRYIPTSSDRALEVMILVFDESFLIVEGTAEPSAVLMQNKHISETIKLIFEMAWMSVRKGE